EGLLHREDRRDATTGRFGESVYVVHSTAALQPCVDSPHTIRRDTAAPNTVMANAVRPPETEAGSGARPEISRGREPGRLVQRPAQPRRQGRAVQPVQLPLLGSGALADAAADSIPATLPLPTP